MSIQKGSLFVVATPIGNLGDLSGRAQQVLREVDLILAEDTRTSARLLQRFNISTPLWAYHEHNERGMASKAIARLESGENLALISDAGTPLIRDPGYPLVRAAHGAGLAVVSVPGPSAVIAALAVSGLPCERFAFEGFLPAKAGARRSQLGQLRDERRTMVFFEAPHRVLESVTDMVDIFGGDRWGAVARELTKIHETTHSDSLERLLLWLGAEQNRRKGELVILVAGAEKPAEDEEVTRGVLEVLIEYLPRSQAVAAASRILGIPRNRLYRKALHRGVAGLETPSRCGDTTFTGVDRAAAVSPTDREESPGSAGRGAR